MPLFEIWMIERFCKYPKNQRAMRATRNGCAKRVGTFVKKCTLAQRRELSRAHNDDTANRSTYAGIISEFQSCIARERIKPKNANKR